MGTCRAFANRHSVSNQDRIDSRKERKNGIDIHSRKRAPREVERRTSFRGARDQISRRARNGNDVEPSTLAEVSAQ